MIGSTILHRFFFLSVTVYICKTFSLFCEQRMNTTLSSLKEKVNTGQCPLPLFTCLHVKPDVSELMFAGMEFPLAKHFLETWGTVVLNDFL